MATRMDRRNYLKGTLPILTVGMTGCSSTAENGTTPADCFDGWSPSIEAEEPKLAPGESAIIRITVMNVSGASFAQTRTSFWMKFNNASLSPRQAYGSDSDPPDYGWDGCTDVETKIPLAVPTDAKPGEYAYGVRVTSNNEDSEPFIRDFPITVSDK